MPWFTKRAAAAVLVRTTVATRQDAERLARRLVEGRLAACVHVAELSSVYRWDGAVRQETEFAVEARTDPAHGARVERAMAEGHPYEVPLVESVASTLASQGYARWMAGELR